MVDYWTIRNSEYLEDKGVYCISTKKLSKKGLYKVGFSGSSLKNRLNQIREVLCPPLNDPLKVYMLIVPKNKSVRGKPQNVRAKELNEIERIFHKVYQDAKDRLKFPDSKKYTEWIYEDDLSELLKVMKVVVGTKDKYNPESTYHLHFKMINYINVEDVKLPKEIIDVDAL